LGASVFNYIFSPLSKYILISQRHKQPGFLKKPGFFLLPNQQKQDLRKHQSFSEKSLIWLGESEKETLVMASFLASSCVSPEKKTLSTRRG
jgi:hypothetical protein